MNGSMTNVRPSADPMGPAASAQPAERQPGAGIDPLQRLPVTLQPDRNLMRYYALSALLFGPGFIIAIFPFYFRFRTLRYDIDAEGITMRWGILFRREISLTYARIQDIQLSSNVVERWLGLARIQLQTASGNASAEMTIEGIRDVDGIRDFLYSRTRGAGDRGHPPVSAATLDPDTHTALPDDGGAALGMIGTSHIRAGDGGIAELAATLDAVAAEVRALRLAVTEHSARGGDRA
jgi:membrane protein YdbS with pleckstrin-like domain